MICSVCGRDVEAHREGWVYDHTVNGKMDGDICDGSGQVMKNQLLVEQLQTRRDFHRTSAEEARQRATRLPFGDEQTEAWRLNSKHLALRINYDAVIEDQTSIAAS